MRLALLHPQQSRHAGLVRFHGPTRGTRKAEQCSEPVFRLIFAEHLLTDTQIAALTAHELLGKRAGHAVEIETDFDRRLSACLAPRQQVFQMRRLVAFEKNRTHRFGNRALAGFVGAGEEVQPRLQIADDKTPVELLELLDRNAFELHAGLASR